MKEALTLALALSLPALVGGCAAVAGAGAAGAAYEAQNKQAIEELEEAYEAGRIGKEEYLERKEAIEGGSVIY